MEYEGMGGRARRVMRAAARAVLAGALLIAATARVDAQGTPRRPHVHPDSVRLVADLFFRAIADERWDAAAAFVDSTVIRRVVAEQLRNPPQMSRREMTIDDFMRDDPNKPRAVAEYELKRYKDFSSRFDDGAALSLQFSGVRSIETLRSLTTREAAVAYLKARDTRVQLREQIRLSGCGDTTAMIPYSIRRILATAVASDTAAYVLYDDPMSVLSAAAGFTEAPTVMMLRARGAAWKIIPSSMMDRMMGFGFSPSCDSTRRRSPR